MRGKPRIATEHDVAFAFGVVIAAAYSGNYVGDSVIGERCNLGAGTRVANLRLDEENVKVSHRGRVHDTGLRKLGVIMGDDVKVGIGASLDVGTIIGEETFIGPGAIVHGTVAARSRIF